MDMAAAVARHEDELLAVQHAEQELVGGLAERRGDPPPLRLFQSGDVVDAAAAQDSQYRHDTLLRSGRCIIPSAKKGKKSMGKLDGKITIVTGATSGIGRRTAEIFVQE